MSSPSLILNTPRAKARLHRALATETGLADYLHTLPSDALLSCAQERTLAHAAHRGDVSARDRLVHSQLALVVSVATCYAERGVSLLDLIGVGNQGLMRAVDRYDPDRGVRLSTYATWWIRRSCQRAVLAEHHGAVGSAQTPLSLDRAMARRHTAQDGEPVSLVDLIPQENAPTVEERAEDADAAATLRRKLATVLSERERVVLALRYAEGRINRQIAAQLGISQERVRQIADAALAKLRASYAADANPPAIRQVTLWQTTPAS